MQICCLSFTAFWKIWRITRLSTTNHRWVINAQTGPVFGPNLYKECKASHKIADNFHAAGHSGQKTITMEHKNNLKAMTDCTECAHKQIINRHKQCKTWPCSLLTANRKFSHTHILIITRNWQFSGILIAISSQLSQVKWTSPCIKHMMIDRLPEFAADMSEVVQQWLPLLSHDRLLTDRTHLMQCQWEILLCFLIPAHCTTSTDLLFDRMFPVSMLIKLDNRLRETSHILFRLCWWAEFFLH